MKQMGVDDTTSRTDRQRALAPLLDLPEFRPLSSSVRVEFGAASHAGKVRHINEDHYLIVRLGRSQETLATTLNQAEVPDKFDESGYAMMVADGLGGTGAGGVASRLAISKFVNLAIHYGRWNIRVDARTAFDIIERLEWCFGRVNEYVQLKGHANPELAGMATTLTAAYSAGDELFVAHVGHSRAYLFREGELRPLTRDQTVENRLAAAKRPISVAYATDDPGTILTDTIGGHDGSPHVQLQQHRLLHGDCVLLCSDGLTSAVDDDHIAEILTARRRLDATCQALIDLALENGGADNITAVVGQYDIPAG
jgi:protein phosphatase